MYFSGGAMAGLLSALIAYINRTVSERPGLRRILLTLALAAVIGSGAAFVTGMYLVGDASAEKTSSHLKGAKEKSPAPPPDKSTAPAEKPPAAPASEPMERAQLLRDQRAVAG